MVQAALVDREHTVSPPTQPDNILLPRRSVISRQVQVYLRVDQPACRAAGSGNDRSVSEVAQLCTQQHLDLSADKTSPRNVLDCHEHQPHRYLSDTDNRPRGPPLLSNTVPISSTVAVYPFTHSHLLSDSSPSLASSLHPFIIPFLTFSVALQLGVLR